MVCDEDDVADAGDEGGAHDERGTGAGAFRDEGDYCGQECR